MEFKKITFKNGLRLILVSKPASLASTVLILVEAGSEYETKNQNGISHFLEHMTFKGTKKRPRPEMIATELDALGAEYNAFTGQEYTGYWAKAENHKLPKILELMSDLYLNPIFNSQEIEKERGVIIEEINMYEDTPTRRVQELIAGLLYGDQPAGWDIAGKKEIIKKLKREEFVDYRINHYIAPSTVVVVAGKFNEKEILGQIKELFGGLDRRSKILKTKTVEKQKKPATLIKFKESDQTHLVLGIRAFDIFDKRRRALQVLSEILGCGMSSRLFKRVRGELGAAYYVNSSPELFLDHGYLAVSAGVDHRKAEIVVRAILEEFSRLTKEFVQKSEFQKAKDHLIGGFVLGLETADALAGFYGNQEILGQPIITLDRIIKEIRAVRVEEARSLAKQIFRSSGLNLAIVGPYKKSVTFDKILTL